jgi:RimJ/RimL family protein N-acetyltransferase
VTAFIETARLTLRRHRVEDFAACAAMWADANVTRYIGGRPFSEEEVWSRMLRYVGHWALLEFGYWVIEETATKRFIGEVGFADFKRDIAPSIRGVPELGWVLASDAHGRGLATEAVRAALTWGDAHFGSIRTVCLIDPQNLASIRVAEKCGYRQVTRTTYKDHPTLLFDRQ